MHKSYGIGIKFDISNPTIDIPSKTEHYPQRIIGKNVQSAIDIISKIDSNSSFANTLCTIMALELGFNIEINSETKTLREIALKFEMIHSHITHIYAKIIPKILGVKDHNEFITKFKKEFILGHEIILKTEEILKIILKKYPHPINIKLGGCYKNITEKEKETIIAKLKIILENLIKTVDILIKQRQSFDVLQNFSSMWDIQTTPLTYGLIKTTDNDPIDVTSYFEKLSTNTNNSITGPISRMNNSNKIISGNAEKLLKKIGIKFPVQNVYQIPLIMAIEAIYLAEKSIESLKVLNLEKIQIPQDYRIKETLGFSSVESSKGLIYHQYEIDKNGIVKSAKIILPQTQNAEVIKKIMSNHDFDIDKKTRKEIIDEISYILDCFYY